MDRTYEALPQQEETIQYPPEFSERILNDVEFPSGIEIDRDTEATTSEPLSDENLANLDRLNQYKKQLTEQLLLLVKESDLEYGFNSVLDAFLKERLAENSLATKEWINSVFIRYFADIEVATGILRTIAHLDYSEISPQGPTIALAALSHSSLEVRECGIRALENWESLECLEILKTVRCPEKWMQDYVGQVISDLEEELRKCRFS